MFEKYSDASLDQAGGGGEYEVVVGFGWSNGVLIWVADTFRDQLRGALCPGLAAAGPAGGDGHATHGDGAGAVSALEMDRFDAGWTSEHEGEEGGGGGGGDV